MARRVEDSLDRYSEHHSAYNPYNSPYPLPLAPHLSTYTIQVPGPMAANNNQLSQTPLAGVGFSQPHRAERQQYVPPRQPAPVEQMHIPQYLPPAQPVPVLSSMSSDNEVPEYAPASNLTYARGPQAQSYYDVRGVNLPAPPLFQYQPQLGYTMPYHTQSNYNITGLPFVQMQATTGFPPQAEFLSQTRSPYTTAPFPHPQSYFTASAPNIQHAKTTGKKKRKNVASHAVEPPPQAATFVDDDIGDQLHSTPVLQRMSSGRIHDDDRRMYVKDLAPQLKQEFASNISQSATLADAVFPTDCLPFPINDSLLEYLASHKIWDIEGARFIETPVSFSEAHLAEWLNILGRAIGLFYKTKRLRMWSAVACNLPPSGSNTLRKPDIVLLDIEDHEKSFTPSDRRIDWHIIRAFAEVSKQEFFPPRMIDTINQKSYLLFLTQDNRRFIPALKFDGSGNMALTITDRQGLIQMGVISILAAGKACALMVLRILAALMYGSPSDIGLDPSMICDDKGIVKTIIVNRKEFTVDRRIYALQALIGRGTKVYVVTRESKYYILKDSWIQSGRLESEIDFLRDMALHGDLVDRIPWLMDGVDLKIGNRADSTEWYRLDVGQVNRHRIHRRHVTEPIGSPLIKFSSKAEFLSVIIDVVQGLFLKIFMATMR
jgi:hypothetical protein